MQVLCGRDRRRPADRDHARRLRRGRHRARQLGADLPPDHVLGRAGLRLDPLRRRLPGVQPVPGDRAAAAVAEPARIRSGSGAGRPRSDCSCSPGSSWSAAGARTRRCSSPRSLGYTVLTLAAQFYWGVETWTRHGEAFAVYFNLFARMAVFATRNGVLGFRRPLGGLPRLDVPRHRGRSSTVMIGTVTFDGLSPGAALEGPLRERRRRAGRARHRRADRVEARCRRSGCCSACCSSRASTGSGSRAHARSAAGSRSRKLEWGFIHSLVPIAAVYVAAHYLTFLLFEGQAITYLASDPFGQGWNLFGTVDAGIDYTRLPPGGHLVRAGRGRRRRARGRAGARA